MIELVNCLEHLVFQGHDEPESSNAEGNPHSEVGVVGGVLLDVHLLFFLLLLHVEAVDDVRALF